MGIKFKPSTQRQIAREVCTEYAWSYVGKWYKWGGDDPDGFDCSGLVIEVALKSSGIVKRGFDSTAQGLRDIFISYTVDDPYEGCLAFYGKDWGHITHVEYCINKFQTIGASGGGSRTLTEKDAIKHNAFIKVRPINSRSDLLGFVDPFLSIF